MKNLHINLFRVLSLLLILALVLGAGSATTQFSRAQQGSSLTDAEAAAVVRASSATPPGDAADATPGEGHLGYDKATGQRLPDSTVTIDPQLSPSEQAEMLASDQAKAQGSDKTQVRLPSGLKLQLQPGILAEVTAALQPGDGAAVGEGYFLMQFDYPFPTQARQALEKTGVIFYDYYDVSTYVVKMKTDALDAVDALLQSGEVRAVATLPSQGKLVGELAALAVDSPSGNSAIVLSTYEAPTQAQLDELGQRFLIERSSFGVVNFLEGKVLNADLPLLAGLDYVQTIEVQPNNTLGNYDGRMGTGSDVSRAYGWDGTGVKVMVVDTGVARSGATYHPDLLAARIVDQWDYQNNDSNAADDDSHGTHVAGTIGGRYNSSSANSNRRYEGSAPGVTFNIYKLCCGGGQFSDAWYQAALTRGGNSNISNNSWGGGTFGGYNIASRISDFAVRGAYGNHMNMVIISHNQNNLTVSPGTAKNAITVGAVKDGNWPNTPVTSCSGVNDYDWPPAQRICFSNYGPIDSDGDGNKRVKPDVMAPGTMITSAYPWYLSGSAPYYQTIQGTSMAAPHVSGAVAQVLDFYSISQPWLFSWPETVKAIMLASAVDVGGNTNLYGRGLIDTHHAMYNLGTTSLIYFWGNILNTSGQTIDFTFNVPAGYSEVRVALTWPDTPSTVGGAEVINDMDLYRVYDSGMVVRGGSTSLDDTVEYAKITTGTAGTWTARVNAYSISSAQRFGLAVQVVRKPAALTMDGDVEYTSGFSVPRSNYFYFHQYISNSGYAAGGTYGRLCLPTGFTLDGVRIYSNDGDSQYYDVSEIYAASGCYRASVGQAIYGNQRHIRWFIQANSNVPCGIYNFGSQAYFTEGGTLYASNNDTDKVIACNAVFVPWAKR